MDPICCFHCGESAESSGGLLCSRRPMTDVEDRFWSKVAIGDGCWEWRGAISGGAGYGWFTLDGRGMGAHRASWILAHGMIPRGMHVCHRCDNPRCVRPGHLFLGTPSENQVDKVQKGRHRGGAQGGERHHMAKLTVADVAEIKKALLAGDSQRSIARSFGVGKTTVAEIAKGARWGEVQP